MTGAEAIAGGVGGSGVDELQVRKGGIVELQIYCVIWQS